MFYRYGNSARQVETLLTHTVRGMQDDAADMLKSNPELALAEGDITDHANRTFKGMTALQVAVCNLDWHMWKMILKHLPPDTARTQAQIFSASSFMDLHSKIQTTWLQFLNELQFYIKMPWNWDEYKCTNQWINVIGGLQRQLPIHCLQEYCNTSRSFGPCPNFNYDRLLRVDVLSGGGCFNFSHLGDKIALSRGGWVGPVRVGVKPRTPVVAALDHRALMALLNNRVSQRDKLLANLQASSEVFPRIQNMIVI